MGVKLIYDSKVGEHNATKPWFMVRVSVVLVGVADLTSYGPRLVFWGCLPVDQGISGAKSAACW